MATLSLTAGMIATVISPFIKVWRSLTGETPQFCSLLSLGSFGCSHRGSWPD